MSALESTQDVGTVERLLKTYARTHDPRVRDQIVLKCQGLVRYFAVKFIARGEPLEDLIQVGNIGLINAVDRYDLSRGLKFSTYATPTIMGEIRRYFRDKTWTLKVPRRLQEMSASVGIASETLTNRLGRTPTVSEIAKKIGLTEEEVVGAIEAGGAQNTIPYDCAVGYSEGDGGTVTLIEFLGMNDQDIERFQEYSDLYAALQELDGREAEVLTCRFLEAEMSQPEIGKRLSISQMHVSRIQKRGMENLRKILLENQARELEMIDRDSEHLEPLLLLAA